MQILELMTTDPRTVAPSDSLQTAAQAMDELNVGVLPVCDGGKLVGLLTDRDIVVRSTSVGQDPATTAVEAVMTLSPLTLRPQMLVEEAIDLMEEHQLRRMPVLDPDGQLVGIVSLGDIAAAGEPEAADALEAISIPAEPDR